jgi:hypothetical protein
MGAENVKLIVSIISLICSITALYFTWFNNKRLIREREEDLFNKFQADYEGIRARMDTRYRKDDWIPDREEKTVWGSLEEYWIFCFREWKITLGSPNRRYVNVWNDFIKGSIKAGLNHRPLRFVLATMRKEGSLSGDYAKGFIYEMDRLHGENILKEFYEV